MIWMKATGPTTAALATLLDVGLSISSPSTVVTDEGAVLGIFGDIVRLETTVEALLTQQQWKAAAAKRLGGGLADGGYLGPIERVRSDMLAAGDHRGAHIVQKIATAGVFLGDRRAEAWPEHCDGLCAQCGEREDEAHTYWL